MPKNVNIAIHLKLHKPSPSSPDRKALHVQSRSYWAPANIGPYSQAISIQLPLSSDEDSPVWAVSIAGQIPFIPHTMSLPAHNTSTEIPRGSVFNLRDFTFQTVLSMQHLWRIGQEMSVQWWTSAVAYLPSSSPEAVAEKAAIASHAWALIHERDLKGEESEEEEVRDLWEEKHYAGMEVRGQGKMDTMLPDWEVVEFGGGKGKVAPPFWVVEVEELPRGSEIEWHAQLGVVGGPVRVSPCEHFDRRC
jgi:diphthine-ammonia ligase